MFQLVGYGDHAGSGLPKIYHNWSGQHWRRPVLYEQREPEQTLMELRMTSLLPADAVTELEAHLGEKFACLPAQERLVLVTAATEGEVHHGRLREISTDHSSDITKMLGRLVRDALLVSTGVGRGMRYLLPWQKNREQALFGDETASISTALGALPPELGALPPELSALSPELGESSTGLAQRLITDLDNLSAEELALLVELAKPVSSRQRATPELVQKTVLALCSGRYLGLRVLSELLKRRNQEGGDLRRRILNPLVTQGSLKRAYPPANDPRQAYTTVLK